MVALKKQNQMHDRGKHDELMGELVRSPNLGQELEYLIEIMKQLQSVETQLDKAREKLIMRC